MNKNLYEFLLAVVFFSVLLSSCKKSDDNVNPGISYGITGMEPAMAGAGDTIKVYGVGFQANLSGNSLTINDADAKIVSATTTQLNVVVPVASQSGKVVIKTGTQSYTYDQPFTVVTVISGTQTASTTLTADKLYLLKGQVHFATGSTLTIQPGTVIMADKVSQASLVIDDGAGVAMNGTPDKPIVFTSNQRVQLRNPGDWTGITLASSAAAANDVLTDVRIEYAGFHLSDVTGAALTINRGVAKGNIQYIQASYSGSDGFRLNAADGTTQFIKYLVAFGCSGNDFDFAGGSRINAQYLLGLKDPAYADQLGADGLLVQSTQPVTVSNLTLMGPNGLARAATFNAPNYNFYRNYDDILNIHGGRGVHIGGHDMASGQELSGKLYLFNSVIAASWLAGVSVDGPQNWAAYGSGTGSLVKYTSVTYTLATDQNTFNHSDPPLRGYVFSPENVNSAVSGFASSAGTAQGDNFNQYNDSLQLQLSIPFITAVNPNATYDELGIANMALYSHINNPLMSPAQGSVLLNSAVFTDTQLSDAFFDKTITFRGALGSADWTKLWSNYSPQTTPYY